MKYNIAMIDDGDAYIRKLFSYMEQSDRETIHIIWLKDVQTAAKSGMLSECDLILVSKNTSFTIAEAWKEKVVYLTASQSDAHGQRKELYLYQPIQVLYQELVRWCENLAVQVQMIEQGTNKASYELTNGCEKEEQMLFTEIHMETIEYVDNAEKEERRCGETQIFSELQQAAKDSIRRKCQKIRRETTMLNQRERSAYLIRKNTNEKIWIDRSIFKIGKDRNYVDYCIYNNPAISRNHADIVKQENSFYIIDNHSLNHTYINGVKISARKQYRLEQGSSIVLADEVFEFQM